MINSINVSEKTNEEFVKDLEAKKAQAVASENFEEAIKIRDQIQALASEKNDLKSDISQNLAVGEYKKEIDDIKTKVDEEKNSKMNDSMWQLHETSDIQKQGSILHDCEKRIADWRDSFYALHGDQEAIQRKTKEFRNHRSKWITTSQFFLELDDLSEEDLQKEYMEHFESQTSEYYLWWVINAVLTAASNRWFFSAMNGKDWKIDEDFSKIIRITEKLINVSKKVDAKLLWNSN